MERKIVNQLLGWKNNSRRNPLIISGARQVGKTHTALTFGREHYKNTVYSADTLIIFDEVQACVWPVTGIESFIKSLQIGHTVNSH